MSGLKVTRIATGGQPLSGGYALDASYVGDDVDVTTGLPLDGLLDVNAPTPGDGEVLTWDDGAGEWIAAPGGGVGTDAELNIEGGQSVIKAHGAAGATETIDPTEGNVHTLTLDADCTLTLAAPVGTGAAVIELWITQDGTGGWDITWPGSVTLGGTLDTTASTTSIVLLDSVDGGASWVGFVVGSGGGGTPATTVTDETTWGITPAVGSDTEYARQDHTHGSPADPGSVSAAALEALGVRGELVVADGTSGEPGLVPTAYVEMTTQRTTTSATLVDITGATTTITLQQSGYIAAWLNCEVSASGASADLGLALSFDGVDEDTVVTHLSAGAGDSGVSGIVHRTTNALAPGTYTVKGRFKRSAGAGTPAVDRADLLVMATSTAGPALVTTEDETDYVYADLGA